MSNIFSDDPMFRLSEKRTGFTPPSQPGEIARGNGWYVRRQGNLLELHYMAGEQGGRSKHVIISSNEAAELAAETLTVDQILIAHGI
jgi:hypothetical protein